MRWRIFLVFAAAVVLMTGAATGPIVFEEIAARAGLRFVTENSPTPQRNQPETMVAGVALLDYDNDGYLDIFFVNGAAIPSLRKETARYWNRLFRNNRDGTFTDVTERAGVRGEGYGMGVAAADYDNDGWTDLFVANVTANQLLRNKGDGTFEDVTAKAKVAGPVHDGMKMWSISAGWFDYDNDGRLDLFISNYCKWEVNKDPFCGPNPKLRAYCHPKNYVALPNALYRNNGDGTFTDVSASTGIAEFHGKGMGVVFADYDHDGFMDVFVANDNAPNLLFRNIGGRKFEEVAMAAGVAFPESGAYISGMGADFRDLDNDGWEDIWHTAVEGETFPLFRKLPGREDFVETTTAAGLRQTTRDMAGWSNAAVDFDNDGWKDLIVARGNVQDNLALMSMRKSEEPNTVFRNLGKAKFEDVSAGAGADFQKPGMHRGLAVGDLDNDGRMDVVMTVLTAQAKLFRNVSPGKNHWVLLKLEGTKSNRSGIGARVRVTSEDGSVQYNHVTTSTGYAASSDPRVHFGLGRAAVVKEIEVTWPSGVKQRLENVRADQVLVVRER